MNGPFGLGCDSQSAIAARPEINAALFFALFSEGIWGFFALQSCPTPLKEEFFEFTDDVVNLKKQISIGEFREDLFHRLSVIPIQVPSLNERKEDIPLLAEHFISIICQDNGMPLKAISKAAITELQKKDWTGNIREFRNVIERLIILCGKEITDKDVKQFA